MDRKRTNQPDFQYPKRTKLRRNIDTRPDRDAAATPPRWQAPLSEINLAALPPLMEITDLDIRETARTHRSWGEEQSALAEKEEEDDCVRHERECFKGLELMGDAYLTSQATQILGELYPNVNAGGKQVSRWTCDSATPLPDPLDRFQDMRSILVSNITYSYFGRHYGLSDTLKTSKLMKECSFDKGQSLVADAFEAYVGGLYQETLHQMRSGKDGNEPFMRLESWTRAIFNPRVFPYMNSYAIKRERMIIEHRFRDSRPRVTLPPRLPPGRSTYEGDIPNQGRFGEPIDPVGPSFEDAKSRDNSRRFVDSASLAFRYIRS